MDPLAILLLAIAIVLVATSWPRAPIKMLGADHLSLQNVVNLLLTAIAVPVCGYVLILQSRRHAFPGSERVRAFGNLLWVLVQTVTGGGREFAFGDQADIAVTLAH